MNDTLMDQCRREAEERYPMPVFESGNYVHTTDVAIAHAVVSARQESHAAALYAERSKRPPTVQGPPMITVDGAMEAMARHYFDYHQHPIGHKGNALYDALTAAATDHKIKASCTRATSEACSKCWTICHRTDACTAIAACGPDRRRNQ
jgi:hypothetical protein